VRGREGGYGDEVDSLCGSGRRAEDQDRAFGCRWMGWGRYVFLAFCPSLPPSLRSFIVIVGLQGGVCDDGLESPFTDACLIQYKFKKDGKCTL